MFELKQKETSRVGSMNLGALGKSFKQSLLLYLIINSYFFQLKFILFTFWEAKLLIKILHSSFANISFSIDNMINPLNLSYDIINLK